jgi:hypothetical protein
MHQRAERQLEEVLHSFKNNKAPTTDMIPIKLIKTGGTELHTRIYNLIIKVWEEGKMPEDWNMTLYCPIHKKGDKTL